MPSKLSRWLLVLALAGGALGAQAQANAPAPAWPAQPIRIVVPYGPGGANDLVARAVAPGVARQLGRAVAVENHPGASAGAVAGAALVARAAPDGHTFLACTAGVLAHPLIRARAPAQAPDFVPVALLAVSPSIVVVPADAPVKNLKGLVSASRLSPGGLNFATAGTGSTPHLVAEALQLKPGANLALVPHDSGARSVAAVAAHEVQATSEAGAVALPLIRAGRLKALAVTGQRRLAALPELPTAQEQGFKDLVISHWTGLCAPRGTAGPVVERMNRAVNAALKAPDLRARLAAMGAEPQEGSREDFGRFLAAEQARLAPLAQAARLHVDPAELN